MKSEPVKSLFTAQDELISAAKSGNGEAFELLCTSFKSNINSYILSLNVSPSERDDLYQEGLIGLLGAVRSYDYESSSFSTYASVCIKRSIISALRKINRNNRFEFFANPESDFSSTVSAQLPESKILDKESMREWYDAFINDLSPFEKRVFKMYIKGASYKKMASELSCAEKSIDNAITRIKSKLKRRLKQR
jgi:RNA polymerase sporulation-specific sigma factor